MVLAVLQVFDGNTETDKTFKFKTGKGKVIKVWNIFTDLWVHQSLKSINSMYPKVSLSVCPLHYIIM